MLPFVLLIVVFLSFAYISLIIDEIQTYGRMVEGTPHALVYAIFKISIKAVCLVFKAVIAAMYYIVRHTLRFVKSRVSARVIKERPKSAMDKLGEQLIISHGERRDLVDYYLEMGIKPPSMIRYIRNDWDPFGDNDFALSPLNPDFTNMLNSNGKVMYFKMNEEYVNHKGKLSRESMYDNV
jgi:hypothetical protein